MGNREGRRITRHAKIEILEGSGEWVEWPRRLAAVGVKHPGEDPEIRMDISMLSPMGQEIARDIARRMGCDPDYVVDPERFREVR